MAAAACGKESGEGGPTPGAPAPITAEQQQAGEQQGAVQIVQNILFEGAAELSDDQPHPFQAKILDLQNLLPPFEIVIESSDPNILVEIVGSDSSTATINPNDKRFIRFDDVIPPPFAIQFVVTPSRVSDRTTAELTLSARDLLTSAVFFRTPPFPITVVPAPPPIAVLEPAPAPAPEPAPIEFEILPPPIDETILQTDVPITVIIPARRFVGDLNIDSLGGPLEVRGLKNPCISQDGRFVVFQSRGSQLVPDDTNHVSDIFIHDTQTRQTKRISVSSSGIQANADSTTPCGSRMKMSV